MNTLRPRFLRLVALPVHKAQGELGIMLPIKWSVFVSLPLTTVTCARVAPAPCDRRELDQTRPASASRFGLSH